MVKVKKANESHFASLLKEINVLGELIRSRQEEKESLIDEFNSESKRFYFGKISEKTISASARKANKELNRLDREIKSYMKKLLGVLDKAEKFVLDQEPNKFTATLSGIKAQVKKKKMAKKKKKAKKKTKKKTSKKKTSKKKTKKRKRGKS